MPHKTGWFPTRRDDVIHMGDDWSAQLDLHGPAWTVPQERITAFKTALAEAKALLAEVQSSGRTQVNTEQCRLAFTTLWEAMQFLKTNYFNAPPRTPDELSALQLSPHDKIPTAISPCTIVPGLSLHATDGHGILVKLFMENQPDDPRSASHFFGKWGLKPAGRWASEEEAVADLRLLTRPPLQAANLPMHFSTSRKKIDMPFNLAEIGMELFVTACWQTPRNQDGPYCPILSRIIS